MDLISNQQSEIRDQKSSGAFTLIELLVVITVIAILMALLFPAFKGVQDQAKRTQAKNDVTQVVTAVNAYYTEYGKYPLTYNAADITVDGLNGNTNDSLFNKLRGLGLDLVANPKDIAFISPPAVKDSANPRSGLGTVAPTLGQYFDPWGKPYIIRCGVASKAGHLRASKVGHYVGAGQWRRTRGSFPLVGGSSRTE